MTHNVNLYQNIGFTADIFFIAKNFVYYTQNSIIMDIDKITSMLAESLDRGFATPDKNDVITGRELAYMVGCGEIYDSAADERDDESAEYEPSGE